MAWWPSALAAALCCLSLAAGQCLTRPSDVLNGRWPWSTLPVPNGTVWTAQCNARYTSVPVPTATCIGSSWVRAKQELSPGKFVDIYCKRVCPGKPPHYLPGLQGDEWPEACASSVAVNSWCRAACDTAGGWFGSPAARCANTWEQTVGKCSVGGACTGVPTLKLTNGLWPTSCADNPPGVPCIGTCHAGYGGTTPPTLDCVLDTSLPTRAAWAPAFDGGCKRIVLGGVDNTQGQGGLAAQGYALHDVAMPSIAVAPERSNVSAVSVGAAIACLNNASAAISLAPSAAILTLGTSLPPEVWPVPGTGPGTRLLYQSGGDGTTTFTLPEGTKAFGLRSVSNSIGTFVITAEAADATGAFAPVSVTQAVTDPGFFGFYVLKGAAPTVWIKRVTVQALQPGSEGLFFGNLVLACN